VIWLQAFGGLLLFVASYLVLRTVIAADAVGAAPARHRRRGKAADLRRAA
jgi:hypothetical protein